MRFRIFPYNVASESARALRDSMIELGYDVKIVRRDGNYRYRDGDRIINWGNSVAPAWMTETALMRTLNRPASVALASNKLNCFRRLEDAGVATIPFTDSQDVAEGWDSDVYVRHVLNGHSGEGVEIVRPEMDSEERQQLLDISDVLSDMGYDSLAVPITDTAMMLMVHADLPQAPLYTKAVDNHGEYRVHVFNGEIIDYRKKSRHIDDVPTEAQNEIRTLGNGWVYRASDLRRVERIEQLAISAIRALGLDFGAVDIIKDENGEVYVLEVNTAVGTDDMTLSNYTNAIETYARTTR